MKREFWAVFDLVGALSNDQRRNRSILEGWFSRNGPSQEHWSQISDPAARQQLLAQLLAIEFECAGRTRCKDYAKEQLIKWYYAGDFEHPRGDFQEFLRQRLRWMSAILGLTNHHDNLSPSLPDLALFPPGSWAVQVAFTLRKPYISKDDIVFYILDNPVKKEWVFKVPYVSPSQWKGALRAAMVRKLVEWWEGLNDGNRDPEEFARRRFRLFILFGDEKGEEPGSVKGLAAYLDKAGGREAAEHFRRIIREHFRVPENKPIPHFSGRLHFYPTFFDRIGLEVINPHARNTGAGKNPIYFECVPAGAPGAFTLLYVPLDAGSKDEDTIKADLAAVARGIKAMLTEYGFGAKTSSGYGVADVRENGVEIRANGLVDAEEVFRDGWE